MKDKSINETEQKIEYLNEYRIIRNKIKSLEEQKKSLIETMRSVKAIDYSNMPKGNKKRDLSDYFVKLDSLIVQITYKRSELVLLQLDIESKIVQIYDGVESDLLRKRYIELKQWEDICVEIGYSRMQIHRLHKRALSNLKFDSQM